MSSQIKITRALRPDPQPLQAQDYRYLPPIQEAPAPVLTASKSDSFSLVLLLLNGGFFGACMLMILLTQGGSTPTVDLFLLWIALVAAIFFVASFIMGAIQALGKPEPEANQAKQTWQRKAWTLSITLLGMLILLFGAFIALMG